MKILITLLSLSFWSLSYAVPGGGCEDYWAPGRSSDIKNGSSKKISLIEASRLVVKPEFRKDMVKESNDCGQIAWFETRRLEGLLDLYDSTNDKSYLLQFIDSADRIYKANDIFHGKVDELRGRVVFGWSSVKYTADGERHVHGVQAGILAEMYARFARTVFERKLTEFQSKAEDYFKIAERALNEVMEDWDSSLGFFRFKPRAHKKYSVYPYNQGLTIASAYIEFFQVYKLMGNNESAKEASNKVEIIGDYFVKTIDYDLLKNRYLWRYAPDAYYEDMSHASLDMNFIMKAYRNGFFFKLKDMKRFANTVHHAFDSSTGEYGRYINGSQLEGYTNWRGLTCLMLTDFSEFKPAISKTCERSLKEIIYSEDILKNIEAQTFGMLVNGLPKLYKVKSNDK